MARRALIKMEPETAVRERYAAASKAVEPALCCPVTYDPRYLKVLPQEILDRDYGCGDPSRYVRPGDTVLDLGSGGGKVCYIASQIVGAAGRVIGVDFHPDMLDLARRHRNGLAKRIGWSNVEFHRARIQDLALSLDRVDEWLMRNPVRGSDDLAACEAFQSRLRTDEPMIEDESVDVVISNCVLNLVREDDRTSMFGEIFRVLKRGGRVAISDIVSDEAVPESQKRDPQLWTGCIAGAFQESALLEAFEAAGFHAIVLDKYDERPWQTVEGIEYRSVTVTAQKGKQGPCLERNQAVIYRGPWKTVEDDDGHVLVRGQRMSVCDKTYRILSSPPYATETIAVPPIKDVPISKAKPFACNETRARRHPKETKGQRYRRTTAASGNGACAPGEACC